MTPALPPDRSVALASGRRVDAWWVSDISDTAQRMADEAGVPISDIYRLIAEVAADRAIASEEP